MREYVSLVSEGIGGRAAVFGCNLVVDLSPCVDALKAYRWVNAGATLVYTGFLPGGWCDDIPAMEKWLHGDYHAREFLAIVARMFPG